MQELTKNWLLEDNNPAVKYRTQTEIMGQTADVDEAREWIFSKLPANWFETKGLWYAYYLTALSECGLSKEDVPMKYLQKAFDEIEDFQYGCADFMLLRALVMLGFKEHEAIKNIIVQFKENSLPDGGFLYLGRLKKFNPGMCSRNISSL